MLDLRLRCLSVAGACRMRLSTQRWEVLEEKVGDLLQMQRLRHAAEPFELKTSAIAYLYQSWHTSINAATWRQVYRRTDQSGRS